MGVYACAQFFVLEWGSSVSKDIKNHLLQTIETVGLIRLKLLFLNFCISRNVNQ